MIHTENINIVPFAMKYLSDYYRGFNHEITKFQWPTPFENIDTAKNMLSEFLNKMEREETLLFSILSKKDKFLGSVEVHGLTEIIKQEFEKTTTNSGKTLELQGYILKARFLPVPLNPYRCHRVTGYIFCF